jgi:hypothetical protein
MLGIKDYGMMKYEQVTSNKNPSHSFSVVFDTISDSGTT